MRLRDDVLAKARNKSIISYMSKLGISGRYVNGRWLCCSPLREEKTSSFSVSPEKNVWYDFGLAVGGDLINLVERMQGLSFREAVCHIAGLKLDDMVMDNTLQSKPPAETATTVPPDTGQSINGRKTVEKFFRAAKLPFYTDIEAFPMTYKGCNYIGVPVTDPASRLGVECRGFTVGASGIEPVHRRMTLGRKLPWIFRRDPERYLVTESIADALAGEVILSDNQISLLALNGVGHVRLLPQYLQDCCVKLALDNDGPQNGCIGQKMQLEAERLLLGNGCHVSHVTQHIVAGVKDLYRLLTQKEDANGSKRIGNIIESDRDGSINAQIQSG